MHRFKLILFIIFIIFGIYSYLFGFPININQSVFDSKQSENATPIKPTLATTDTSDDLCISRVVLGDLNKDKIPDYIEHCKDWIGIYFSHIGDDSLRSEKFEDIESFTDLFKLSKDDTYYLSREVILFPEIEPQFIVVKSIYYSGGSYLEPFGIYKIDDRKLDRVFKHGFRDMKGRSVNVEFSELSKDFAIESLSRSDSPDNEWYLTTESYSWDYFFNKFELINSVTKKD